MSLRFQLDEHVAEAIALGLRRRDIDVRTAHKAGLRGISDTGILERARVEARVIVTHDQDYLRLHAQGVAHHGIAFAVFGTRSIGEMIAALVDLDRTLMPGDMRGQLVYL